MLDGRGEDLAFGGRVMKNVAGFDVSRLITGSLGTLGIVLEVSLKCLPLPKTEATLVLELAADHAIRRMNELSGQPLPLTATCYGEGKLYVRLSGAHSAVLAASRQIGGSPRLSLLGLTAAGRRPARAKHLEHVIARMRLRHQRSIP